MRTNIDIDDELMDQALRAGPYKTKKEAVEAGLRLVARQAAYREILKWEGKLKWEGDESVDWTQAPPPPAAVQAGETARPADARYASPAPPAPPLTAVVAEPSPGPRRARR